MTRTALIAFHIRCPLINAALKTLKIQRTTQHFIL